MKGFLKGLAVLVVLSLIIPLSSSAQVGSLIRRLIGTEDIYFAAGGTGAAETWTYVDPAHNILTLHKLDASYIKFRTSQGGLSQSLEALVDGTQTIDLKPNDLDVGGDLTVAGTAEITGNATLTGLATFATIPVGPNLDPSTNNQLARKSYVDAQATAATAAAEAASVLLTGDQTVAGVKTFSSFPVTPSSAPTTNYQVPNKLYVDNLTMRRFALLQNRQTQNTGGGTATTGSWGIIPLNTEYEDANSIIDSSALPAFSLESGTYQIEAYSQCHWSCQRFQIRLYRVTTTAGVQQNIGAIDMYGDSAYCVNSEKNSNLSGTFTVTGTVQFRIEYYTAVTVATDGLGRPGNLGPEVYAQVMITKLN